MIFLIDLTGTGQFSKHSEKTRLKGLNSICKLSRNLTIMCDYKLSSHADWGSNTFFFLNFSEFGELVNVLIYPSVK